MLQARKTIKAQKLWFAILESQVETGTPYMLYKDACNSKSNQQNLGCIKVTPPPYSSRSNHFGLQSSPGAIDEG